MQAACLHTDKTCLHMDKTCLHMDTMCLHTDDMLAHRHNVPPLRNVHLYKMTTCSTGDSKHGCTPLSPCTSLHLACAEWFGGSAGCGLDTQVPRLTGLGTVTSFWTPHGIFQSLQKPLPPWINISPLSSFSRNSLSSYYQATLRRLLPWQTQKRSQMKPRSLRPTLLR